MLTNRPQKHIPQHKINPNPVFEYTDYFGSFGLCDSPEQFYGKFRAKLEADPRTLYVTFTHIPKETPEEVEENKGGFRPHKWGEYVGEKNPPMEEYLAWESGFELGIWIYRVTEILD